MLPEHNHHCTMMIIFITMVMMVIIITMIMMIIITMVLTSKIGAKSVLSSFCQELQVALWSLMTQADMATPDHDDDDDDDGGGDGGGDDDNGDRDGDS